MIVHVKDIVWFMLSVTLSVGALIVIIGNCHEQYRAAQLLASQMHIQKSSISAAYSSSDADGECCRLYSGQEVVYSLRTWYVEQIEIVIDQEVIVSSDALNDQSITSVIQQGLSLIDLNSTYRAMPDPDPNKYGTRLRIVFNKT